jgi:hypothetical protein
MHGRYRQKLSVFVFLFVITILLLALGFSRQKVDITNSLVRLGNPFVADGKVGRALNVWDLQVFDGKIYIAGGSTIHNSGPINVWAYNPANESFEKEYTVDEEAIEHFKVFDNELYIPAADTRFGDTNKFYRKQADGTWHKYSSNSVTLAHVRDLIKTNSGDILLVGNNRHAADLSKPATAITTDNGNSFQGAGLDNVPYSLGDFNYFFTVFSYKNIIYSPSSLLRDYLNLPETIAVYNHENKKFELDSSLFNSEFIPKNKIGNHRGKYEAYIVYRIWNPVEFKSFLIYPMKSYSFYNNNYEKAYMNSLGFYVKENIGKTPRAVQFPDGNSLGEDVLVLNNELYALANQKISPTKFIIYVYKTDFLNRDDNWKEVLHFQSSNKARSFE